MNTEEQKRRPKIAMILFAKNEEQHITKVIEQLKPFLKELPPSELFIYDDSTDSTLEIAKKLGAIPLKGFKLGLGWAYYTALQSLSFEGGFHTFITLDADGQTHFQELPVFYNELQKGYDLVVGSRFINKNSFSYSYPKINFFGVKIFSFLITIATLQKFTDSHGGMRIMTSKIVKNLRFLGSHSYVQETLIEAVRRGFMVREIPCFWQRRVYGKSRVVDSYVQYALKMGGPLFVRARLHWPVMVIGSLIGFFSQKLFVFSAFLLFFVIVEFWKRLKFVKNRKQIKYYVSQLMKQKGFSCPQENPDKI